jgi:rhomboid family GlyGly-CTERM serine protease
VAESIAERCVTSATHDRRGSERALGSTPWLALAVPLLAGLVQVVPGASQLLELDRATAVRGELWRVLGGHLAHYSLEHFLLDAAVFLVLGLACEIRSPRRTRLAIGLGSILIPISLFLFAPELDRYRGLSGLDSALFALLVMLNLRAGKARSKVCLLAGLLFLGKLAFELGTQRAVFLDSSALEFTPVPLAHAIGALCGVVAGIGEARREEARRREPLGEAAAEVRA